MDKPGNSGEVWRGKDGWGKQRRRLTSLTPLINLSQSTSRLYLHSQGYHKMSEYWILSIIKTYSPHDHSRGWSWSCSWSARFWSIKLSSAPELVKVDRISKSSRETKSFTGVKKRYSGLTHQYTAWPFYCTASHKKLHACPMPPQSLMLSTLLSLRALTRPPQLHGLFLWSLRYWSWTERLRRRLGKEDWRYRDTWLTPMPMCLVHDWPAKLLLQIPPELWV